MNSIAENPAGVNYNHLADVSNHVEVAPKAISRRYEAPPVPAHLIAVPDDELCITPRFVPSPQVQAPAPCQDEGYPLILAKYKSNTKLLARLISIDGNELPAIVSLAEMEEQHIPEPQTLIEGLLHQGEKMVLAGTSKSYKTWSLIDLGLSVASGKDWWGRKTTQGKVLYINFEIDPYHIRKRSVKVADAKNIVRAERENFRLWNLRGFAADFATLRDKVAAQAGSTYKLIVIDPVYKGLGDKDENKAGDIAGLLNQFEKLAVMTGAAVVFGHHYPKGNHAGKDPMDRMGGSGVFARDPDTLIALTRQKEGEAFTVDCITRNFMPNPPFCIRWDVPLMQVDSSLNPKNLKEPGSKPKKYQEEDTLAELGLQTLTYTEWFNQTKAKSGISESMFRNHKKLLEDTKLVEKTDDGKYIATAATAK